MARYLSIVQITTAPLPRGSNSKVCVMSLSQIWAFEKATERFAPGLLLALAVLATAALASV